MKNRIIFMIFIVILFTVGVTGVYASSYNGDTGSHGGSSSMECMNGSFCNNTNFKAVSITLYWIEADGDMKKVSGTNTIVINNGNGPSKNCSKIGGKNWCSHSKWFSSKTYGYKASQISKDIGSTKPNKADSASIRRMTKWIAALFGESKTFDTKADAQKYVQKKLPKLNQSCVVDKTNSNNKCKNKDGYRIVIEPVIGYQRNGKYNTGNLKAVISKYKIGEGKNSQNVFNNLMATSFKDVGIDYKDIDKCTYKDLAKTTNVNGCGWNILDIGPIISSIPEKNTCTITNDGTMYDTCLDKDGKPTLNKKDCITERKITKLKQGNISNIAQIQYYKIPSYDSDKKFTKAQVNTYIKGKCTIGEMECTVKNGRCYYNGLEYSCSSDTGKWIKNGCPPCWYGDDSGDSCSRDENKYFYYDTSGDGTSITKSLRRTVHVYSSSSFWNGSVRNPSCGAGESLNGAGSSSSQPSFNHCDNSLSTADCTHDSTSGPNYQCQTWVVNGCSYTCVVGYEDSTCTRTKYTWVSGSTVDGKYTPGHYETSTEEYPCKKPIYDTCYYSCWHNTGPYYSFTPSWTDTGRRYKEYYIDGSWKTCSEATSWVNNRCTYNKPKCSFDKTTENAWYDNNGNHHVGGLTKKVSLWINKGCPVSREKTKTTCSNCNSTSNDGGGYTITESTNWDQILGNYYGTNKDDEYDLIEEHYKKVDSENGDQVYCSESLNVKLPNGKTTNLNTALSGRYITVNLGDAYDNIMNLSPISITRVQTCKAINNSEVTISAGQGIRYLSQLSSSTANDLLREYVTDLRDNVDTTSFGNIKLKYNGGTYNLTTYLNSHITQNDLRQSGDAYVLTQSASYTLGEDIYRYVSMKDGSSSEKAPDDTSKYYDLGMSTLPVKFESPFNGKISFVYDYDDTTFEDEFDNYSTWFDASSQTCANNIKNEDYYTCAVTNNEDANSNQKKCRIQKTTSGTKYYYNNKETSESDYRSKCSCFEKNGNYYLNGEQIGKSEYERVCPAQCTTTCPAGEICCPTGGSDMPCSVGGVCPTTGGNSKLIYRTIDLKNPFTGQNTRKQGRKTGSNWCSYNIKSGTLNCDNLNDGLSNSKNTSNKNSIVYKHIKKNAGAEEDNAYRQTPQYSITLNSTAIDKVRAYNDKQKSQGGYDDFTLSCYNAPSDKIATNLRSLGIYTANVCRSSFIRDPNIFKTTLSGKCSNGSYDNLLVCSEKNN